MGSMAEALRHLVRSVGGKRAREIAETVVEERQKPGGIGGPYDLPVKRRKQ